MSVYFDIMADQSRLVCKPVPTNFKAIVKKTFLISENPLDTMRVQCYYELCKTYFCWVYWFS